MNNTRKAGKFQLLSYERQPFISDNGDDELINDIEYGRFQRSIRGTGNASSLPICALRENEKWDRTIYLPGRGGHPKDVRHLMVEK
ncbi:MAG TPA: hypothetical protein VK469_21750 [Candidatus Kapabacteria bacterium]|nr:hypothetical protein [Candidatus Kapabacteria bacterium]